MSFSETRMMAGIAYRTLSRYRTVPKVTRASGATAVASGAGSPSHEGPAGRAQVVYPHPLSLVPDQGMVAAHRVVGDSPRRPAHPAPAANG